MTWQPIESAPRDATVLVTVKPTEANKTFATWPVQTHPAYIDDEGYICDASTMKLDKGLHGQYWQTTHWMPFPAPFPAAHQPIKE